MREMVVGKAGPSGKWGVGSRICALTGPSKEERRFSTGEGRRRCTIRCMRPGGRGTGPGSTSARCTTRTRGTGRICVAERIGRRQKSEFKCALAPGFVAWRVGSSAVRSTTGRRPFQVNLWESDEGPAQGKVAVFFSGTRPSAGQVRGTKTRKVKPVF